MLSITQRLYQLNNGHYLKATIEKNGIKTTFQYGYVDPKKEYQRLTMVSGISNVSISRVIETVENVNLVIGDKIVLLDEKETAKVNGLAVELLDSSQLQFVAYDKADKVTKVYLQNVGGNKC